MTAVEIKTCLYCSAPPTSPEHIIPSALGGVLRPLITCRTHNGAVNGTCDAPLIEQMNYLVHALRVVKDRRGSGSDVEMTDAAGAPFRVDSDHRPFPLGETVLERDAKGKPSKLRFNDLEHADKVLGSMGLSIDDPSVAIEHIREAAPPLETALVVGGPDGMRGILKIAYEFVRGYQKAEVCDPTADAHIQQILVSGLDPMQFVRWLPFELLPQFDQAPYFSHRIMAWQDDRDVIAVVELFNVYPFAVRLQGLRLERPVVFNQGLQGETPTFSEPRGSVQWHWNDVPLHAQPLMFTGVRERFNAIMQSMVLGDLLRILGECVAAAVRESEADTDDDAVVALAMDKAAQVLPTSGGDIESFRDTAKALVAAIRSA